MPVTTETAAKVTFDRFWHWLREHGNCILRAGSYDAALFDMEEFHWGLLEEDGRCVVQMMRGKLLVGELVIERSEIQHVRATPDPEDTTQSQWLFEIVGGPPSDTYAMFHFLVSHGMDAQQPGHSQLKH